MGTVMGILFIQENKTDIKFSSSYSKLCSSLIDASEKILKGSIFEPNLVLLYLTQFEVVGQSSTIYILHGFVYYIGVCFKYSAIK